MLKVNLWFLRDSKTVWIRATCFLKSSLLMTKIKIDCPPLLSTERRSPSSRWNQAWASTGSRLHHLRRQDRRTYTRMTMLRQVALLLQFRVLCATLRQTINSQMLPTNKSQCILATTQHCSHLTGILSHWQRVLRILRKWQWTVETQAVGSSTSQPPYRPSTSIESIWLKRCNTKKRGRYKTISHSSHTNHQANTCWSLVSSDPSSTKSRET